MEVFHDLAGSSSAQEGNRGMKHSGAVCLEVYVECKAGVQKCFPNACNEEERTVADGLRKTADLVDCEDMLHMLRDSNAEVIASKLFDCRPFTCLL